jgi:predicted dehydrogenase
MAPASPSRRDFLKTSTTAAAAGAIASQFLAAPAVHAAGDDVLKIGLIGCGGRGSGAAVQALTADPNTRLTAMGDVFSDYLEAKLESLKQQTEVAQRIDVPPERRFVGFDAYKQVINSGVDVVLLATPPHFRPMHLKAAIEAGKHVFAEKPVAVDAPGVRSVLETCQLAAKKGLNVVSGLCLRYGKHYQAAVGKVQDGAIGDVRTLFANDYRGPIWMHPRKPEWTDMDWQMRNWYYFTWLSGDFNVEQHVHMLDVCAWLMNGQYPDSAIGMGGRQVRTGPEYGNIYDHHSVVYQYASGTRLVANTRQIANCKSDISVQAIGAKGIANISDRVMAITGETNWKYDGVKNNIYQTEHDELFAAIRKGKAINNGEYMSKSTLLAILGRMATYTGKEITWDAAYNSKEDLNPPAYEWGKLATPPVAMPGVTKFS